MGVFEQQKPIFPKEIENVIGFSSSDAIQGSPVRKKRKNNKHQVDINSFSALIRTEGGGLQYAQTTPYGGDVGNLIIVEVDSTASPEESTEQPSSSTSSTTSTTSTSTTTTRRPIDVFDLTGGVSRENEHYEQILTPNFYHEEEFRYSSSGNQG